MDASTTFSWTLEGSDAGDFTITRNSSGNGELKFRSSPNFESPADSGANNVYNVTVKVTDNGSPTISATRAVTINVTNVDEAGTVTVTGTLSGGSPLTATLSDLDGTASSTSWQWARGDSATGTFSNISSTNSATYTLVAADVGKYLRATASYTDPQGSGKSASGTSSGAVGASNADPAFSNDTTTRTVPENSGTGASVGSAVTASDSDGDPLSYSLSGVDAGFFRIVANTGQIRTTSGVTYNFEAPKNTYTVTVNVRDSKDAAGNANTTNDDSITVTINLTNVNEAPTIDSGPTTVITSENRPAVSTVVTFMASDVDASTNLTWSLEGTDSSEFTITKNPAGHGVIRFKVPPNFEAPTDAGMNNTYNVRVKVTDNGTPAKSDTHTFAVTVTNVNEAPTIDSGPTGPDFEENTPITTVVATYEASDVDASTTLTWTLEGTDRNDFAITKNSEGDGELRFMVSPNFEMPHDADTDNDYAVTVKVTDNGSPQRSNTRSVTVTVTDVNDAPVVSGDATPSKPEIEFDATSADLTIGTYTATDEDGDTVSWILGGTDRGEFHIESASGVLRFVQRPDFENPADAGSNNSYEIVVQAYDTEVTTDYAVTVTVTNVNETPEITDGDAAPSFDEIAWDATSADLELETYNARDEEGETISWSVNGTDAGDFSINSASGLLSFAQRPNFEMPADNGGDNVYDIIVKARDTDSNTRDFPVTVTVNDVNETPRVTGGAMASSFAEIEYDLPAGDENLTVGTYMGEDDDADDTLLDSSVTWSLSGADASHFTITKDSATGNGVLSFNERPDFEMPGDTGSNNIFDIIVQATDGSLTGIRAVTVTVTDINEKPELTGTPLASVTLDEHDANEEYVTMTVASYTARDEEGTVTWSLTGTDSGDFTIDTSGAVTFVSTPSFEDPDDSGGDNVYTFTVFATDTMTGPSRRNVSIDVTVTVEDIEETGTITVDNLNPSVGDTLTFKLSDPDDGIQLAAGSDINWQIEQRQPGGGWLQPTSYNNPLTATFTFTPDAGLTGFEVRAVVTYTDRRGSGKSAESEPTNAITADPIINAPPRFQGASFSITEGPAGRDVGQLRATDRDNDTITFGLGTGSVATLFEINSSTGQIRAIEALDFETQTERFLLVPITLHDGRDGDGNPDTTVDVAIDLLIRITDVEEEGAVTLSADEPEVGVALMAMLTDGDGSISGEMWRWARSENGRTGWTNISGETSSSYTPDDDDGDFFLRASVTYTDSRGGGKSAEAVTAGRVPSENRRPTFPSTEDGARTVPENTRAGVNIGAPVAAIDPENNRLVYTLTGADAAAFTIVASTGQLRTSETLDFETQSSYSVTVNVHDGRDGSGNPSTEIDVSRDVTITIENVEEPGTVTLTTDTETIQARVPVTAELTDDDGPTGVTWQWHRSPNGRTGWVTIANATSATYMPTLEEDAGNYIRATASYTDGHGAAKTAQAVSPRVGDPPPVNSAPAFPSTETGQRRVPEDAAAGASIGDPVVANDLNAEDLEVNDPLSYSLGGTDADSFTIDASTGQLSVASGVTLDYEGKRSHRVIVSVTDGRDENGDDDGDAVDDTINVTVTVTNVNEAPVVTGPATATVEENASDAVASYTGTDPERDTLTWSTAGADGDSFAMTDRGRLHFASPPSFEGGKTTYEVTVVATDEDALTGMIAVTVTVTDEEEEGVVTITPLRGWTGTRFSATLTDDDGSVSNQTWQWARSTNRSGWTDITNATSSAYTATADDIGNYLRVSAEYTDRTGSGKTAEAVLTTRIADVADRPAANTMPEFADAVATRFIGQGTAAGRSIGAPVRATDADRDDVLVYSLSGTDADSFDIDPATGQLRTKAVLAYDPEGTNTYMVTVNVHDGFRSDYTPSPAIDAMIEVTITVTAVSPPTGEGGFDTERTITPPIFREGFRTSRTVPENAQPGEDVGLPVRAWDVRDEPVTFTLAGADAASFTVDEQTGQIRVAPGAVFDFEGERTVYEVSVVATNTSGGVATLEVVIRVTNVELPGAAKDYDLDRNELIDLDEAIAAVRDYFDGIISLDEATTIVVLYFQSPLPSTGGQTNNGGNAS